MALDPIKISQTLDEARSNRQRAYQQARLKYSIEMVVHDLFDEPQYPKRRRSFGAIKTKLGIFDGKEQELRDRLFGMHARVHNGEGDDQLWHLPAHVARPTEPPKPKPPFVLISLALLAGLVSVFLLWETITGESPLTSVPRIFGPSETHITCLQAANGIWTEIMECHKEYGKL